jgi:hypothetical protein
LGQPKTVPNDASSLTVHAELAAVMINITAGLDNKLAVM